MQNNEKVQTDRTISRALFHRVGATFLLAMDAKWISISQMQSFVCMQYFEILKQEWENSEFLHLRGAVE